MEDPRHPLPLPHASLSFDYWVTAFIMNWKASIFLSSLSSSSKLLNLKQGLWKSPIYSWLIRSIGELILASGIWNVSSVRIELSVMQLVSWESENSLLVFENTPDLAKVSLYNVALKFKSNFWEKKIYYNTWKSQLYWNNKKCNKLLLKVNIFEWWYQRYFSSFFTFSFS